MAKSTRQWLESEITCESSSEKQIIRTDNEFGIKPFTIKFGRLIYFNFVLARVYTI